MAIRNLFFIGACFGQQQAAARLDSDVRTSSGFGTVLIYIIVIVILICIPIIVVHFVRKSNRESALALERQMLELKESMSNQKEETIVQELQKYEDLFKRGIITEQEYEAKRKQILNI